MHGVLTIQVFSWRGRCAKNWTAGYGLNLAGIWPESCQNQAKLDFIFLPLKTVRGRRISPSDSRESGCHWSGWTLLESLPEKADIAGESRHHGSKLGFIASQQIGYKSHLLLKNNLTGFSLGQCLCRTLLETAHPCNCACILNHYLFFLSSFVGAIRFLS